MIARPRLAQQPNTTSQHHNITASQRHDVGRNPSYYKYGTIERFMLWRGTHDGQRLHPLSKAIGVYLLVRAITSQAFTCSVSETEACSDLSPMDAKTFRKYLRQLTDFGLIKTDRRRSGGMKRYDVKPIYERFGQQRIDPDHKVTALQNGSVSRTADRENIPVVRESFPVGPGPLPSPDRESFPVSTKVSPSSVTSGTSSPLEARAKRLGITSTSGLEREIIAIDEVLRQWAFRQRRQRWLVKRFGIVAVAGAIGYVLQQQRITNNVGQPDALFLHALENRWCGEVPLFPTTSPYDSFTTSRHHRIAESPPEDRR